MSKLLVAKAQRQLVNCSIENFEISKKLQALKQSIKNDNLLLDIHREEVQTFIEQYVKNSILIGESIIMLGLDDINFILN